MFFRPFLTTLSLRPIIEGKTTKNREALFGAIYPAFATKDDQRPERDIYAIYARDQRWKYIYYLQDVKASRSGKYFRIQAIATEFPTRKKGDEDLYDLDADPLGDSPNACELARVNRSA